MYNVAIIGCGSIGALKNDKHDRPGGDNILTHAHAVVNNPKLELLTVVDSDYDRAEKAHKKWQTRYITSAVKYLRDDEAYDAVCIATPTETHLETVKEVLKHTKPKVIVMEKPMGKNLSEAKEIKKLCDDAGATIVGGYQRLYTEEYSPSYTQFWDRLHPGDDTPKTFIQNCTLHYTRGIKREASHALSLFLTWFGEFKDGRILPGKALDDYSKDDLTYPAHLEFERCPHVFLIPCNGNKYAIFDIQVVTENEIAIFCDHGEKQFVRYKYDEPVYGDYQMMPGPLSASVLYHYDMEIAKTALPGLWWEVYHVLSGQIKDDEELTCDEKLTCPADHMIAVHEIYERLGL